MIIVACPRAGKHDTASKKVAKHGAKSKVRAASVGKQGCVTGRLEVGVVV